MFDQKAMDELEAKRDALYLRLMWQMPLGNGQPMPMSTRYASAIFDIYIDQIDFGANGLSAMETPESFLQYMYNQDYIKIKDKRVIEKTLWKSGL